MFVRTSLLVALAATVIIGHDLKGFDDTIMFHLNFPGHIDYRKRDDFYKQDIMSVLTSRMEHYDCALPSLNETEDTTQKVYDGPSPFELVSSLFSSTACSYRIESYWTYEVCHGHYIKQYHEEREGKTSKIQEYYLGKWNKQKTEAHQEKERQQKAAAAATSTGPSAKPLLQYKKVMTSSLPYFEVEMTDGTLCDLNNDLPRVTKVLYVCYLNGKNEVFSLKETSTCNYEVIILTPALCTHPDFKPQETVVSIIHCIPFFASTPKKPKMLMAMDVASMKLQYQKLTELKKNLDTIQDIAVVNLKDGNLRVDIMPGDKLRAMLNDQTLAASTGESKAIDQQTNPKPASPTLKYADVEPVIAFLTGKNCLTGGTGWWKYEFCYGRYVRQFHVDKNGETSVTLGFFDADLHRRWMQDNESKRPQLTSAKPQLTHFYSGGTVCQKTGKQRQVEVKLKCMENSASKSAVSLYLMEPKTCEYVLGVESPLICDIMHKADSDGLIAMHKLTDTQTEKNDETGIFLGNAVVEDFEVRFEND